MIRSPAVTSPDDDTLMAAVGSDGDCNPVDVQGRPANGSGPADGVAEDPFDPGRYWNFFTGTD
jgi:hypothetical protein